MRHEASATKSGGGSAADRFSHAELAEGAEGEFFVWHR